MNKTLASLAGAACLAAASTFAQAQTCDQCGTLPPPPPTETCKVKGNAGIGNKGEGKGTELNDCDPGKSGLHNQAWKNADKPHNGGGRPF